MSSSSPDTREKFSSQIPASKLLHHIGYRYLTPAEASQERRDNTTNVLLYTVLKDSLMNLPCNQIELNGVKHTPPEDMLKEAIKHIDNHIHENIIADNKALFKKLTMGETFRGTIDGKQVQKHLKYIDFNNFSGNQFHFTEEFSVLRTGVAQHYRPDIVAFINGIPVIIIENKRRGRGQVERAVKDHLEKQKEDGIKRLYVYSQILLAMAGNKAMYGSIGAKINFWNRWRDKEETKASKDELRSLVSKQPDEEFKNALFSWRDEGDKAEMQRQWDNLLEPTEQDKLIFNLLRPERIIKEIGLLIVFEGDAKIIARHQQYFGIENALEKIKSVDSEGVRAGGLFWHTTGSGKSVTMVMLAKVILDNFSDPRIVLVTDRVDLDQNIYDCFTDCGVVIKKVPRGKAEETAKMITNRDYKVISTVIDRLQAPLENFNARDNSNETFIFVDEAHRTHSEVSHKRAVMKAIFPKASIIGFTGTPISKKNNDTVKLFGGWIHKYTMDAALEDEAVCRIVYSNKNCPLSGDDQSLDRWFERRTRDLSDDKQAELRRIFKGQDEVLKSTERRKEIAYDISEHFKANYRAPVGKIGLKGMFATSSKYEALKYLQELELNGISCNLVISPPGEMEGEVTVRANEKEEIERFWTEIVERKYGGHDKYLLQVTQDFKKKRDPEILIVVDMLLTGFNNPSSAVLYTDKTLKEHKVLQAIARVNRPYPGKEYGEVVDYRNIIGDVTSAIQFYRKLEDEGYEPGDIKDALFDVETEIGDLDSLLKKVWDCFPENSDSFNRGDQTLMVRHLMTKETYSAFVIAFSKFHYKYKLARGFYKWLQNTAIDKQEQIQRDYKYFVSIRAEAEDELGDNDGVTYAELVDDIRRFVEDKITADPPVVRLDKVEIFSKQYTDRNEKKRSKRSQADSIRVRLKNYFEENWDEDPILAQQITEIIEETFQRYENKLDSDIQYFNAMTALMKKVEEGEVVKYPEGLQTSPELKAYFSLLKHSGFKISDTDYLECVTKVREVIKKLAYRDWTNKKTVMDQMEAEILKDVVWPIAEKYSITLDKDAQDKLVSSLISIAKRHQGR